LSVFYDLYDSLTPFSLYSLAVALVAAGLSVGTTLLWLRYLSRLHRHRMDQLLALRDQLHEDPLGTLMRHQQTLAQVGLRSIDWQGRWYGAPVVGSLGAAVLPAQPQGSGLGVLTQLFQYDDISLTLRVGLKGLRGERLLFAMQAAEVLFAMLQGALAARQLALVAAVNQRARVGVFLQHDMRNLAQWVQLVAEDFGAADSDELLMLRARRLRKNATLAADRAKRMAQALLNPAWQPAAQAEFTALDLPAQVLQAGHLHQVAIELEGTATLQWDGAALATVLDNLLGNVSGLSRERLLAAHCKVVIREAAGEVGEVGGEVGRHIRVHFETPHLPLEIPLEKLFEPWSNSRALHKGLGMYQARKQAEQAGGQLYAEHLGSGLRVVLCVPCQKS
jgi:signal transduction histidine kinase